MEQLTGLDLYLILQKNNMSYQQFVDEINSHAGIEVISSRCSKSRMSQYVNGRVKVGAALSALIRQRFKTDLADLLSDK